MPEAVIVSAVRTPIGRASKGSLRTMRADDLAAVAVRAAAERVPNLDPKLIEDVIIGCAFPEGEQGMNVARLVTALAGLPVTAGGTTVNRFCASSLQAFNMGAQNIMLGMGDVFVIGGVEAMSRVPMGGFNPSFNPKLTNNPQDAIRQLDVLRRASRVAADLGGAGPRIHDLSHVFFKILPRGAIPFQAVWRDHFQVPRYRFAAGIGHFHL